MTDAFTSNELLLLEALVSMNVTRYRAKIDAGEVLGLKMPEWEALQAKVRRLSDDANR